MTALVSLIKWLIFLGVVAVGVIYVLPRVFPSQAQSATALLPVDCYVGMTGEAVSITVSGVGAGLACDKLISTQSSLKPYRLTQAPTNPIMCEYTLPNNLHFIVRDEGLLKMYGKAFCAELEKQR